MMERRDEFLAKAKASSVVQDEIVGCKLRKSGDDSVSLTNFR